MFGFALDGLKKLYGRVDVAPGKKTTALSAAVPLIQFLLIVGLIDKEQADFYNQLVAAVLGVYTLPAKGLRSR